MIIATCGDEIKNVAWNIEFKGTTGTGEKCNYSGLVCPECYKKYYKGKEILISSQKWVVNGNTRFTRKERDKSSCKPNGG